MKEAKTTKGKTDIELEDMLAAEVSKKENTNSKQQSQSEVASKNSETATAAAIIENTKKVTEKIKDNKMKTVATAAESDNQSDSEADDAEMVDEQN